jgi:surface antigen
VGALLGGVLACAPAATAAPGSDPKPQARSGAEKRDKKVSKPSKASLLTDQLGATRDGLTRSTATYKKSSYLCYGYSSCTNAGYSNAGYSSAGKKMYWRMYAGHNCTNYVAYRMVQNGMPNVRPWTGGGNATYWGTSVPQLTDGTPSVGAVAWWKANTGPAGSAGHVAYVEQVVSADEIIVSQDSWNGDFSWARITRSSGNWPSGFIHFTDLTVQNTAAPVISGDLRVGTKLTASAGTWNPTATSVGYQWFANGQPIKGAKKATLSLGKGRVGQTISVLTTASRDGYNTQTAAATAAAPVQPGVLANTGAPGLSGTAKVERSLTVTPGTWSPVPAGYSYAWYANGVQIPNATGTTLKLTPELAGQSITASATASRAGYADATLGTVATAPVAPGTIRVRKQPSVTGIARPGHTLTASTGTYRPADTTATVQWLRDGVPIDGATAPTYAVTEGDLGTRISASITASRAGYDSAALSTEATAPVKVLPRIKVQRKQLRHGVRLVVQVVARYVPVVQGNVIVKVKRGFVKKVPLNKHGVARVVVVGLKQGKHPARIGFTGAPTVQKSIRKAAIRMPAPKR